MTAMLKSILEVIGKVMPLIVFVCLAAAMLFDPARDTLGVASAAFAVSLALAAVTFSYARTLKEGSGIRDELVFSGERLVSGAVLFLIASILKHASHDLPRYMEALLEALPRGEAPRQDMTFLGMDPVGFLVGFAAFMVFLIGLLYAQMGIMILVSTAGHRAKRRAGHNAFFVATKLHEHYLADLEKKDGGVAPSEARPPSQPPATN